MSQKEVDDKVNEDDGDDEDYYELKKWGKKSMSNQNSVTLIL